EYLLTPEAQKMIADGNDEFPVVSGVAASEAVVNMGDFKRDPQLIAEFAPNNARAQEIYNEIGYK
ncbi:MAG: Fe(3+) ABC transporter substrate-binding protein, partial [Pseudomonadota bacterium]